MSQGQSTGAAHGASGRVEIRVRGRLEPRWSAWLDGMTITAEDDGTTLIHGPVVDQAALFGLLQRLRDIAVPLVSLVHVEPPAGGPPAAEALTDRPASPTQRSKP